MNTSLASSHSTLSAHYPVLRGSDWQKPLFAEICAIVGMLVWGARSQFRSIPEQLLISLIFPDFKTCNLSREFGSIEKGTKALAEFCEKLGIPKCDELKFSDVFDAKNEDRLGIQSCVGFLSFKPDQRLLYHVLVNNEKFMNEILPKALSGYMEKAGVDKSNSAMPNVYMTFDSGTYPVDVIAVSKEQLRGVIDRVSSSLGITTELLSLKASHGVILN